MDPQTSTIFARLRIYRKKDSISIYDFVIKYSKTELMIKKKHHIQNKNNDYINVEKKNRRQQNELPLPFSRRKRCCEAGETGNHIVLFGILPTYTIPNRINSKQ